MSACLGRLLLGVLSLSLPTRPLGAQGVTSAALQGSIVQVDGTPIDHAVVTVTAAASGASWRVAAGAAGRYFVENLPVGGPYLVEARAMGFKPMAQGGVVLTLGQRYRADFVLEPSVVALSSVIVSAGAAPALDAGRSGPAHIITETEIAALPNLSRDLTTAAALAPLAVLRPLGGMSVDGQNQGFNTFQVDGGVNQDLYLGRTPGGASPSAALPEVLPHAISLETISALQVLAAPFDVRLGNFAAGLLNAVTKSGTNIFHGSAFGYLQDGALAAKSAAGNRSDFRTWQFGGTLSGPVVRDRVHFFLNADLQQRVVADPGPLRAADAVGGADVRNTGISYASALRFQQILRDRFLVEPGTIGPSDGRLPARDLFAKITAQLGAAGRLELSQHYAHADRREFIDTGRTFGSYALSSVAGRSRSTAWTSRLIWSTLVGGRAQNEFILSHTHLHDSCRPSATLPLIQVDADQGTLMAGSNSVCPTTDVRQRVAEITENLTVGAGSHVVTLGSHGELLHFRDPLVQVSAGRWLFSSLDSLEGRLANHYDRGLGSSVRRPGAAFHAFEVGLYAQDRWAPTSRFTITGGLRLDVPLLPDAPTTNQKLRASPLGVDTGRLPSGNVLWSPRLGVTYDLRGDGSALLRGGIGLFSGPPPYRWLGNGYRETGDETVVFCNRPDVPPFDPTNQPGTCLSGRGTSPRISFFDPGLKLPQNLKVALGVDRRFPSGVATLDFLYTRAVHQIYISEANLRGPIGAASGEGGRLLYGTIRGTATQPAWRDTSFGETEVYRVSNRDGDNSFSLSAHVRKQIRGTVVYASYAYSRAQDRMSWVNFPARANFSNTPLDGTLDERRLRPSFFETPHKVSVASTVGLPHRVQLSLLYLGASQPPYTFVIDGDANADGVGGAGSLSNDAVYVPHSASDVTLAPASDSARLREFIEQRPCLREQRGRIMERNSCRNGWLGSLNARIATNVPTAGHQRLEVIADIVNVPNLINSRWGRHWDTTNGPSVRMLRLKGWDAENARGIYQLALPPRRVLDVVASRWRVQLGTRYSF